jgi:hypothetical protein
MLDPAELALREKELKLEEQKLLLEHKRLYVEFAKYGFAGTLTGAIIGLVTVVGLAALNAFTEAKIATWAIVAIAAIVLLGSVAFGYFSLWELPRIAGKFTPTGVDVTAGSAKTPE